MSWQALTSGDIETRLSGPELTQLQSKALASGQSDPLPEVLTQVTNEIRGYIAAWPRNTLGPAGTIPDQLQGAAIALVRWRLAGRLSIGSGGSLMQSENRKAEYDDAMRLLRDVATGKFAVETPDDTGPETMPDSSAQHGSDAQLDFS